MVKPLEVETVALVLGKTPELVVKLKGTEFGVTLQEPLPLPPPTVKFTGIES